VPYLFLGSFIGGLLLAVRLMFFGAERRRHRGADSFPLRRSEPALVAFLLMFGIAGYLLTRHGALAPAAGTVVAVALALAWAALVTRLAIATARLQPGHDPDDLRYLLQGRLGIVTVAIPAGGEGMVRYEDGGQFHAVPARGIGDDAIAAEEEICIDRIEAGVAHVEPWKLVEQRL
jgi:membrane protein implicated in regulation of membrane protease activity